MINVTAHSLLTNNRESVTLGRVNRSTVLSEGDGSNTPNVADRIFQPTTVSSLARQLSEAAIRAESRFGQIASSSLDVITTNRYFSNKVQHDSEVPKGNSPELLVRARQATDFVNGSGSNPFKGLSRDQLSLIAHDEGGSFTINERRAAWQEVQSTVPIAPINSNSASVSGRNLMISRLFGNHEPSVARPPLSFTNIGKSPFEFLTRDDRTLVSEMYAYAQEQGADLRHVDNIARLLGDYRHHSDGRQILRGNNNNDFDADGYMVTYNFKEEDAVAATRILKSSAINSTRIDQGFLRHFLDPGYGALTNTSGLAFLEQMVIKFSNEGDTQTSLDIKFANYKSLSINDNTVFTTHKDVKIASFKPHAISVNGTWTLTEFGKSQGYTLDKVTGQLSKPVAPTEAPSQQATVGKRSKPTFLDALRDTRDQPVKRWIWPGHLFKLMKNYKP